MRQLAQVLAFTHQQGITHRDIKPENLLLQDNGNIALCDFDISKDIISGAYESTLNLSAAGTLAHCAPEAGLSASVHACCLVCYMHWPADNAKHGSSKYTQWQPVTAMSYLYWGMQMSVSVTYYINNAEAGQLLYALSPLYSTVVA